MSLSTGYRSLSIGECHVMVAHAINEAAKHVRTGRSAIALTGFPLSRWRERAGVTVGAIVAVNAMGDVVDPASGAVVAGSRGTDGRLGSGAAGAIMQGELPAALQAGMATTIGVIATDAVLTKAQARKLAQIGHDGFARTIEPSHTLWDGDTLFAVATGQSGLPGNMMTLGVMAARVVSSAILRAVLAAKGVAGIPARSELG